MCNFLDAGKHFPKGTRIIYRHYATLYFVFVVDGTESELGILDLIQTFVETLDKCFKNVCELDLVFHMDKVGSMIHELDCASRAPVLTVAAGPLRVGRDNHGWYGVGDEDARHSRGHQSTEENRIGRKSSSRGQGRHQELLWRIHEINRRNPHQKKFNTSIQIRLCTYYLYNETFLNEFVMFVCPNELEKHSTMHTYLQG